MRWTIDQAIAVISRSFPGKSIEVHDGDYDYVVGTIEDDNEHIAASFLLALDSSGGEDQLAVTEIRIGEQQRYCGMGSGSDARSLESAQYTVPITITRRSNAGCVWGLVGDYEVHLHESETISLTGNGRQ